jgi:hypothetical protein
MGLSSFDENTAINSAQTLNAASGTGEVWLWDETPLPSRVDSLVGTTNDVIDHVIALRIDHGGGVQQLGSVTIPAGSGYGATPTVDLLAALPVALQGGLLLSYQDALKVQLEVAVTAAFVVDVLASGGRL